MYKKLTVQTSPQGGYQNVSRSCVRSNLEHNQQDQRKKSWIIGESLRNIESVYVRTRLYIAVSFCPNKSVW